MKTLESIAAEALLLSPEDRLSLAQQMLSSVDNDDADPEWEAAWDKEIKERIRQFDAGEVQGIPGPEVMEKLRRRLAR